MIDRLRLPLVYVFLAMLVSSIVYSETWKPMIAGATAFAISLEAIGRLIDQGLSTEEIAMQLPPIAGAAAPDSVPAYPGAVTYGATALNTCRSLTLATHRVTNTNASGDGSLQAIVEDSTSESTFDIITATVGGTIDLAGAAITLLNGCTYVALQTAPGGGIAVMNDSTVDGTTFAVGSGSVNNPASNSVIRGFSSFKMRCDGYPGGCNQQPNFRVNCGQGILVAEMLIVGANDQVADFNATRNCTLQDAALYNSIVDEAYLEPSCSFSQVGTTTEGQSGTIDDLERSLNHFRCQHRSPGNFAPFSGAQLDDTIKAARNRFNVIYEKQFRGAGISAMANVSAEHNRYKPGQGNDVDMYWNLTGALETDQDSVDWTFYGVGNIDGGGTCNADMWNCFQDNIAGDGTLVDTTGAGNVHVASSAPGSTPKWDFSGTWTADTAYTVVVTNREVGPWRAVNCNGVLYDRENTYARDLLDDVRDSTFVMKAANNHLAHATGFPTLAAGTTCTDTDGDAMPDSFETTHSISDAGADPDADGWLNIEEYVNGTNPNNFTEADGTENPGGPAGDPADKIRLNTGIRAAWSVFVRSIVFLLPFIN